MKNKILHAACILSAFIISQHSIAQVKVGGTPGTPATDAILELGDASGSTKGLILTRVATISRPAASTANKGMIIFNTTTNTYQVCDGSTWIDVNTTAGWSATGNSGTTPGTNFIGTTDSKDLVVKTNNAEAMRIASNGNVGIGNPSPAAALDITSTTSGLLVPRMTGTQRDAMVTPAKGTLIYNTSTDRHEVNVGTAASPVWNQYLTVASGDQVGTTKSAIGSTGIVSVTMGNLIYDINISTGYYPEVTAVSGSKVLTSFEEQRWGSFAGNGMQTSKNYGTAAVGSDYGTQTSSGTGSAEVIVSGVAKTVTTTTIKLCSAGDTMGSAFEMNRFLVINTTDVTIDDVKMFHLVDGSAVVVVTKLK